MKAMLTMNDSAGWVVQASSAPTRRPVAITPRIAKIQERRVR